MPLVQRLLDSARGRCELCRRRLTVEQAGVLSLVPLERGQRPKASTSIVCCSSALSLFDGLSVRQRVLLALDRGVLFGCPSLPRQSRKASDQRQKKPLADSRREPSNESDLSESAIAPHQAPSPKEIRQRVLAALAAQALNATQIQAALDQAHPLRFTKAEVRLLREEHRRVLSNLSKEGAKAKPGGLAVFASTR